MEQSAGDEPRDTLDSLRQELQEKDEALQLAAKFGQQLLESNSVLSQQLEEAGSASTAKLEKLEQECYGLRQKLEQTNHMKSVYRDDMENLEKQAARKEQQYEAQLSEVNQKVSDLQQQVSRLTGECERGQEVEERLRGRVEELVEELAQARHKEEPEVVPQQEETSQGGELTNALERVASLERQVKEMLVVKQKLEAKVDKLCSSVQSKERELEQAERQSMSHYSTVQKSREEIEELRVEIDLLQMESQNQRRKGNSLFSEVEDRRVDAEKALLTMTNKYEALQTTHRVTAEQFCRVKSQLAGMLQMCSQWADQAHVERLNRLLCQAQSKIEELLNRPSSTQVQVVSSDESGSSEHSVLTGLLTYKEKRISELEEELRRKELSMFAESQKVTESEKQLYTTEVSRDKLQAKVLKLEVQLTELRLKYDAGSIKPTEEKKVLKEKIPIEQDETQTTSQNVSKICKKTDGSTQKKKEQDPMVQRCLEKLARKRNLAPSKPATSDNLKSKSKKTVSVSEPIEDNCEAVDAENVEQDVPTVSPVKCVPSKKHVGSVKAEAVSECQQQ